MYNRLLTYSNVSLLISYPQVQYARGSAASKEAVILRLETGLGLPSAPEFGPNGQVPPETTDWVPLRWQYFKAKSESVDAAITYEALHIWERNHGKVTFGADSLNSDFLHEFFAWVSTGVNVRYTSAGASVTPGMLVDFFAPVGERRPPNTTKCDNRSPELRRLVHSVRWRRDDPVTRLPPGSTAEMTSSETTGLSIESSVTLANSLGIDIGGSPAGVSAKLNSELRSQFMLQLNITSEHSKTNTLTLQNNSENDTLYALWHKQYSIAVTAMDVGPFNFILCDTVKPHWPSRGYVEFDSEDRAHITSMRVDRP